MIFDEEFIKNIEKILEDIENHTYFTFKQDKFFNCYYDILYNKKEIGNFRFTTINYVIEPDDLEKYSGRSCPIKLDESYNFNDYEKFKQDLINCFKIEYKITTIFDFI